MGSASAPRQLFTVGRQPVHLTHSLGRGGEGEVFATQDGRVCKVFHTASMGETRAKLELMTRRRVAVPGVCWPQELVVDGRGHFAGYSHGEGRR